MQFNGHVMTNEVVDYVDMHTTGSSPEYWILWAGYSEWRPADDQQTHALQAYERSQQMAYARYPGQVPHRTV